MQEVFVNLYCVVYVDFARMSVIGIWACNACATMVLLVVLLNDLLSLSDVYKLQTFFEEMET